MTSTAAIARRPPLHSESARPSHPVRQAGAPAPDHGRRERAHREPARPLDPAGARGHRRGTDQLGRSHPARAGARRDPRARPPRGAHGVPAPRGSCSGPRTKVEYDMRNGLYSHLQDLPVAFHDRWQCGQLLSPHDAGPQHASAAGWRSVSCCSSSTCIDDRRRHRCILFRWHWLLGTIFLVCSVPLWYAGYRFEKTYGRSPARARTRPATSRPPVEESVHGIRVLKAFGRGKHALRQVRSRRPRSLRSTEMSKARAVGVDLVLAGAGARHGASRCASARASGSSQLGQLQVGRARRVLRDGDRAALADRVDRLPALVHARRPHRDRPHLRGARRARTRSSIPTSRATIAASPRRARVRGRALPLPGCRRPASATCSTASTSCSSRARPWRSSASPGRGKTTLTDAPSRLYDVTGGRGHASTASTCATSRARSCARTSRMAFEDATLFSRVGARQRAARPRATSSRAAPRPRRVLARGARRSRRRASSTTCPTASTRSSAKRA